MSYIKMQQDPKLKLNEFNLEIKLAFSSDGKWLLKELAVVLVGLTLLHVFRMRSVAFLDHVSFSHYSQRVFSDATIFGFEREKWKLHSWDPLEL